MSEQRKHYIKGVVCETRIGALNFRKKQLLAFGSVLAHTRIECSHFLNTQSFVPHMLMLCARASHQNYSECPNLGELG